MYQLPRRQWTITTKRESEPCDSKAISTVYCLGFNWSKSSQEHLIYWGWSTGKTHTRDTKEQQ